MRYGRIHNFLLPSQVETPEVNVNEFINAEDGQLWGKFPDGSVQPLTGMLPAPGAGTQAIYSEESAPNTISVDIDGIIAYNAGDVYNIYIGYENTGAITLDINELGAQSVRKWGDLATPLVAGDLEAGTVNRFLYTGGAFEWIGQVRGGLCYNTITLDYTDFAVAAGSETLNISRSPAKVGLDYILVRPTVKFIGGGATTVDLDIDESETGLSIISGSDVLADVTAVKGAQRGPVPSTSVVFSRTGLSTWEATLAADVNLDQLVQGSVDILLVTRIIE